MKKPLIITVIVLIIVLILPAAGFFGWFFKEKKPMNIVILDKTVHNLDRSKHRSLTWVLANSRFVKKDNGRKYLLRQDYYGFFPIKPLRSKQFRKNDIKLSEIIDMADNSDLIYYADTYGVFFNDWYQGINRSRRSRMLYGGLNNSDYLFLAEMKKREKLVILEYNSFDYPTDAYYRYRVEEQLGIQSSGWTGEYYPSLDSMNVPEWLVSLYTKTTREPWSFQNAGIVLLKGDADVIILEEGKHLRSALPVVVTSESVAQNYRVVPRVSYSGPFEIVDEKDNAVLSNFQLETTDEGMQILDDHFLRNTFPAVIGGLNSGNHLYMCGDFATGKIGPWTACFGSLNLVNKFLYKEEENDPDRFFWLYYRPLLAGILNDYYETLNN
jgi:hypothetical protein